MCKHSPARPDASPPNHAADGGHGQTDLNAFERHTRQTILSLSRYQDRPPKGVELCEVDRGFADLELEGLHVTTDVTSYTASPAPAQRAPSDD